MQCQQAKHDPSLSTAKALSARKSADAAPAAAAPANGGVVAAIKRAAAGKMYSLVFTICHQQAHNCNAVVVSCICAVVADAILP